MCRCALRFWRVKNYGSDGHDSFHCYSCHLLEIPKVSFTIYILICASFLILIVRWVFWLRNWLRVTFNRGTGTRSIVRFRCITFIFHNLLSLISSQWTSLVINISGLRHIVCLFLFRAAFRLSCIFICSFSRILLDFYFFFAKLGKKAYNLFAFFELYFVHMVVWRKFEVLSTQKVVLVTISWLWKDQCT